MEQRTDLLIWIDLETTGLDISDNMHGVHNHKIVEVGSTLPIRTSILLTLVLRWLFTIPKTNLQQ